MHVSHSIFSEVPLGSKKHTEDTEINLFDAERERAFKTLPTPFFFCSSYEADAGWGKVLSKQLSSWNAPEQELSPWSPEDPGTLKHPWKEKREGKSGETQTLKMEGFPHIGLLVMGSPRISGRDGTPWRQNSADRLSPQTSLSWCLTSHKKEKDVKETWDKREQSSQNLMENASSYNHL